MDTSPKERRFWFLHLSTAVLLMFVIGTLLFVNICQRQTERESILKSFRTEGLEASEELIQLAMSSRNYGWPKTFYSTTYPLRDLFQEGTVRLTPTVLTSFNLIYDVVIAVVIVVAVLSTNEFLIRRREARRSPAP